MSRTCITVFFAREALHARRLCRLPTPACLARTETTVFALSHPVREPSAFNAMNHCASLWVYTEGPPIPYVVTPRSFSFLSRGVEWVATHKGGSGGSHELRRHLPIALVQNATDRAITERLADSAGGKTELVRH